MRYLLFVLVIFTTGCSTEQWNEKLSTPKDRQIAEKTIEIFRGGDVDQLEPLMEQSLYQETRQIPESQIGSLAANGSLELVAVNSSSFTTNGQTETKKTLNYQYGSESKWFIFQVMLKDTNGEPVVAGWQATPFNVKPTSAGDFSFSGKSFIHFFWLGAMIVSTAIVRRQDLWHSEALRLN